MESSTLCKDAKEEHKGKCSIKSFSPKSHQGNKCYGGVREEEQGWWSTNDLKI
jgi:hypothetical protein